MKIAAASFVAALILLGAGCSVADNSPKQYDWQAYDRGAATTTVVSFTRPASFSIKQGGSAGNNEKIYIGNITGKIEIYNFDFYGDENVYKDYPEKPKATYKKGNFFVYVFYEKGDTAERDTLINIVNTIKVK
jgi:hypothetical protein